MGLCFFLKKTALESHLSFEILYRFFSGSYVSLLGNPIMDMGVTEDVGRRLGMFLSILSIGALAGPPISGAIGTATGGFKDVGFYAGLAYRKLLFWKSIAEIFMQEHPFSLVLG